MSKGKGKLRKSVWLPLLLLIYFLVMAVYFGRDLITGGRTPEFIGICAGELAAIILLAIFLRKRERKEK